MFEVIYGLPCLFIRGVGSDERLCHLCGETTRHDLQEVRQRDRILLCIPGPSSKIATESACSACGLRSILDSVRLPDGRTVDPAMSARLRQAMDARLQRSDSAAAVKPADRERICTVLAAMAWEFERLYTLDVPTRWQARWKSLLLAPWGAIAIALVVFVIGYGTLSALGGERIDDDSTFSKVLGVGLASVGIFAMFFSLFVAGPACAIVWPLRKPRTLRNRLLPMLAKALAGTNAPEAVLHAGLAELADRGYAEGRHVNADRLRRLIEHEQFKQCAGDTSFKQERPASAAPPH